jgi:hypothetical protein
MIEPPDQRIGEHQRLLKTGFVGHLRLGRLTVPAPIAPPPYHGLLDGFTTYLCESGG